MAARRLSFLANLKIVGQEVSAVTGATGRSSGTEVQSSYSSGVSSGWSSESFCGGRTC
jgi:hypothetical protein